MNPVVVPETEKLVTLMFSRLAVHVCLRTQGTLSGGTGSELPLLYSHSQYLKFSSSLKQTI